MSDLPPEPWSDGQLSNDGRFIYDDPPGTWNFNTLSIASVGQLAELQSQINQRMTFDQVQALLEDFDPDTGTGGGQTQLPPRHQEINSVGGTTPIDLTLGYSIFARATTGPFTPEFVNRPVHVVVVHLLLDVTNDGDELLVPPGFSWEGPSLVTADFDAGKRYLFEFVILPNGTGTIEHLGSITDTPGSLPAVTPPTISAFYSTSATGSSPTALDSATFAGNVAIWATTSDDTVVSKVRFFWNLVGSPPAASQESSSTYWVGSRTVPTYSLLGNSGGQMVLADTTVDPTGNSNPNHDPDGPNTLTVDAELIDGTLTAPATFTFTLSNTTPSADAVLTDNLTPYGIANAPHTVTIPSGVDRGLFVAAHYRVTPNASQSMIINSLQASGTGVIGGPLTMNELTAATNDPGITDGAGTFVAWLPSASLQAGQVTITPIYSSPVNAGSSIVYHAGLGQNMDSIAVIADDDFDNVGIDVAVTGAVTLSAVPANSIIISSISQANTTASDPTTATGTMLAAVTASGQKVRATKLMDSGTLGDKTVSWSGTGRSTTVMLAISYAASGGGPETPPITPGKPVVTTPVPVGDNQATPAWSAASDAVSYQIRWDTNNPITRTPVTIGNVLTYQLNGLAPTLQYFQVRARSSTDTFGEWSDIVSFTPTGTPTPLPDYDGRTPTTTSMYECSMGEGNQSGDWGDVRIPQPYRRINIGQSPDDSAYSVRALINTFAGGTRDLFISRWQNHAYRTDYHMATGPRGIISGRMCFNNTWSPHLRYDENPTYARNAVLDMARVASTGAVRPYDYVYQQIGEDLNRTVTVNGQSFRLADHVFYSIGHEPQAWSSNYWGTNTKLIGDSTFLVSATDYGPAVKAAMDRVYNEGVLTDLWMLAAKKGTELIKSRCADAQVGLSPAVSTSSVPVGTPSGNLSNAWPSDAILPLAGLIDFLTPTDYPFRGKGSLTFIGGDVNNPANYLYNGGGFLDTAKVFAEALGVPFGLLEYSGSYNLPGEEVAPGTNGWFSDAEVRMIHRRFDEVELPAMPHGNLWVNHWLFPTWDQSRADAGKSWIVLEGCFGRAPNGFTFSSTSKPSWSTVSATEGNYQYQQTLDWFRGRFPR